MQLSIDGTVIVLRQSLGAAIDGADISLSFKSIAAAVCGSFEARLIRQGMPHV